MTRIRDPIHGSIALDARELAVVDSPFFQRLRSIRQTGFADLAFPGATHSRYVHALGACHLSGRIFERIATRLPGLPTAERERLRAGLRLAVLLHDLGHAPFSHSSESIMPPRASLRLPSWLGSGSTTAQANHEDYTLKLVLDSDLADVLRRAYGPLGLPPEAIAGLIGGVRPPGGPYFVVDGVDVAPLLRQVIS
ncbi:MAG TPA: HD domain-containing protein, partial [Vulgatibacter sp.]|nr:HD domain-containing protein [Vulgatibacter sp.]